MVINGGGSSCCPQHGCGCTDHHGEDSGEEGSGDEVSGGEGRRR